MVLMTDFLDSMASEFLLIYSEFLLISDMLVKIASEFLSMSYILLEMAL